MKDMTTPIRVLIVDDQDPYRRAMASVVESTANFVVIGDARSGEEAVEAAAVLRPHLVLMDLHLPAIDGIEAGEIILGHDPDVVIVLLSTYDSDEFDLVDSGASEYIPKSALTPRRLTAAWQRVADQRPSAPS